jgi:hypothetical protein
MTPLSDTQNRKRHLFDTGKAPDDDEALVCVPRRNKRVRFELHSPVSTGSTDMVPFGDIIKEEIYESRLILDDLDKEELWWSRGERCEMVDISRKLARGFKRQHKDCVDHYLSVFDECSKKPSHASSDFLETVQLGVPTQVRGLECGFIPSVKSWRRNHAQEVLQTQDKLMKGSISGPMRLRVLSSRSMHSSRPSRVMARLIGEADAIS